MSVYRREVNKTGGGPHPSPPSPLAGDSLPDLPPPDLPNTWPPTNHRYNPRSLRPLTKFAKLSFICSRIDPLPDFTGNRLSLPIRRHPSVSSLGNICVQNIHNIRFPTGGSNINEPDMNTNWISVPVVSDDTNGI